jgi:respiratory burst oxidase
MKLSPLSFSTSSSFSHADGIDDGVELISSPFAGGAMLPVFLNDLSRNSGESGSGSSWERELVEVTLELDVGDDSILVCGMSEAASVDSRARSVDLVTARLSRNLSNASTRIRQKLGKLLRSESWKTTTSSTAGERDRDLERQTAVTLGILTARDKRKEDAKLQRSTSSAQRALKGLQFINKTTRGNSCVCDWDCDCDQMWKKVEKRFESLSKNGLLARDDFGECVGKSINIYIYIRK